jgi:hypothetical protein
MAEKLFWVVFEHLDRLSPRFTSGKAVKSWWRKPPLLNSLRSRIS